MKPMLAEDWVEEKLVFPLYAQPKIDGVRGLNYAGLLYARSMKQHQNKYTTRFYGRPTLEGLDGEFAAEKETHPDLCRITSSALRTIEGEPYTLWWLFDYFGVGTEGRTYEHRYAMLQQRVDDLKTLDYYAWLHLRVVPSFLCNNLSKLLELEERFLAEGYEGIIARSPTGLHKQGRSTVREGGLLRNKQFVDAEAEVLWYEEGEENCNVAQVNELGRQFRSTHAENMIPNGQVGTIHAKDLETGQMIKVSPGNMPVDDRKKEWIERHNRAGRIFTYKHFPKGRKDLPRFPTWKFWRDAVDMSK